MESKIVCHHIGGRGFGVSFNAPPRFWDDIVHVLYEADPDNVEEMRRNLDHPQRALLGNEFYILPCCVGEFSGRAKLKITANPFASSVLEPNEQFFQYYCEVPTPPVVRDFTYHDMLEVVRRTEVTVEPLDEILRSEQIPYRIPPDFLSIDTQGYELPIMRGGRQTIMNHVLGMVVEIEIKEMYTNQPLFGDVLQFLTDAGFHFAGFTYLQEISTFRAPVGFRGKGFPGFGDALFLRRLDDIGRMAGSVDRHRLLLRKMAFIALNFGFTEYALSALCGGEKFGAQGSARKCTYDRFLDEMLAAYRNAEQLYPRFVGVPHAAQAAAAAELSSASPLREGLVHSAPKTSLAQRLLSGVHDRAESDSRRIRHLALTAPLTAAAKLLLPAMRRAGVTRTPNPEIVTPPSTPESVAPEPPVIAISHQSDFERLLEEWGFAGVAGIVRNRRSAAEAAVRAEGPASTDGPDFGPAAVARMSAG